MPAFAVMILAMGLGLLPFLLILYLVFAAIDAQRKVLYIEYHEALGPLSRYYNPGTGEIELPEEDGPHE